MQHHFKLLFMFVLLGSSCNKEEPPTILEQITTNYPLLPEAQISQSTNNRVYAAYTSPTERYAHGILGDKIEAGQMVVAIDNEFYGLDLPIETVFEDIRPRLYDVDNDGELEFITIRSNVATGAGIFIYKLVNNVLIEYAHVPEIGQANRWLNIVAIHDLDNDGVVEIVWIETPHIGGILKVAKIKFGLLEVIDETSLFSNHAIGQRNLCLSVLVENNNQKVFYVPSQNRDKIHGFVFENNQIQEVEVIDQLVDFKETLLSQYEFSNVIVEEDHCIVDE